METILEMIRPMIDEQYGEFQRKLIPNIDPKRICGVRTPDLKNVAKSIASDQDLKSVFMNTLPHDSFEEDQIHAFLISSEKNFESCIEQIDRFLPFVNNWATCDQMSPKVFQKRHGELLEHALSWTGSSETYTRRFGIGMLMRHYLDSDFDPRFLKIVADAYMDEYYVNMMRAWYFATALAKQYDDAVIFIENGILDKWTGNKSIQKAIESFRVTDEHKEYLKRFRR